jgi:SEC-C motif
MVNPANPKLVAPAVPSIEGVTKAERYLAKLCKRSFLSLWSYPSVYRDQGRFEGKVGDGKEVCDLLVVFENHVIIFSDKDCKFGNTKSLEVGWPRWYRKAVRDSARQIWGAERWIRDFSHKLFLDRKCTFPFPIKIPKPNGAIFHRVVVAHDAARACAQALGGSGSLMICSDLEGDSHFQVPFTIGRIDSSKGYVHVFDDTSLNIVMSTLDTITDFVTYLTKKEQFLTGKKVIGAAGEEELLAVYLRSMNAKGERDFIVEGDYDLITLEEGFWTKFSTNPQRLAQIESDRISYSWDELIEKFAFYAMTGTQYITTGQPLREQEVAFRFLAKEPRFRRRVLATALHDALANALNAKNGFGVRVIPPSEPAKFPCYVFLFLRRREGISDEIYRQVRMRLLADYCQVAKLTFSQAIHIVGIATEAGLDDSRSEDLVYMDTTRWSAKDQAAAQKIQDERGFLKKLKPHRVHEYEYPIDHKGRPRNREPGRNSPCPCGSNKRYKRCHGAA